MAYSKLSFAYRLIGAVVFLGLTFVARSSSSIPQNREQFSNKQQHLDPAFLSVEANTSLTDKAYFQSATLTATLVKLIEQLPLPEQQEQAPATTPDVKELPPAGTTTGKFIHPIRKKAVLTSGFGWRRRPYTRRRQFHYGIDLSAPIGTPVHAVDGGEVIYVTNYCVDRGKSAAKLNCGGSLGNWIDIKHSNGLITRYGHLQRGSIRVRVGMKVSKGDEIASVGNSGWSTGPHLDFRIHDGKGNYQNPGKFIAIKK